MQNKICVFHQIYWQEFIGKSHIAFAQGFDGPEMRLVRRRRVKKR